MSTEEQEYLYQISQEENRYVRHDSVRDYIREIVIALGYNSIPEAHNFEGPDLMGDVAMARARTLPSTFSMISLSL